MAFLKKEFMEYSRNKKLLIFGCLALLFGLMNPAIAKLTPKLYEMMAESLKNNGITIESTEITAFTCWEQYYKNIAMLFLIFLLLSAACFSGEYSKGTLLLVITKGYSKTKIYAAKVIMLIASFTCVNLIYFGITWFYSDFYWDNSVLSSPFFAAFACYLLGLFMISVLVFFSTVLNETTGIMAATGITFIVMYLLSIIPTVKKYLPVKLMEAGKLLNGSIETGEFTPALIITGSLTLFFVITGMFCFRKSN